MAITIILIVFLFMFMYGVDIINDNLREIHKILKQIRDRQK